MEDSVEDGGEYTRGEGISKGISEIARNKKGEIEARTQNNEAPK